MTKKSRDRRKARRKEETEKWAELTMKFKRANIQPFDNRKQGLGKSVMSATITYGQINDSLLTFNLK